MENPIVQVHQGQLQGVCETNGYGKSFMAFRGVPYAKPPIGELRFKDSEPIGPWSGVKDATKFGGRCAQRDMMTRNIIGSDDCLYLNIYTPTLKPTTPKAVMFWIHGGAFVYGSGDDDLYAPDYLIEKDIVLVTINYRVGILGFLNVDDEVAPGNQGLKDQVLALQWVKQNISKFGGDPNNVTIFGESAGSASVHYLTISPLAQGLFHKAILQSGTATNPWASVAQSPSKTVQELAKLLEQDPSDPKKLVEYLRKLESHRLVELENQLQTPKDKIVFIHPFLPSVDVNAKNSFLSVPVEEAAKGGIKVPIICGYVSHEGIIIVAGLDEKQFEAINADPENLLLHPNVQKVLNKSNLTTSDMKKIIMGNKQISKETMNQFVDLEGSMNFILGIHNLLEQQIKIPNVPTYVYKLSYEAEDKLMKKFLNTDLEGTCHAEDLRFIFYPKIHKLMGKDVAQPESIEYTVIQRITELWTNFAKTGKPVIQKTELIPVLWKPIDNAVKYDCLMITDNLSMGIETNILHQWIEKLQNKL